MILVKKDKYKDIEYTIEISTNGLFTTTALFDFLYTKDEYRNTCTYNTMEEVVKDIKIQIDKFLDTKIKTYKELANRITESLVW